VASTARRIAFRGPLLCCRFLFRTLLSGFTLGAPIDSVGIDQLRLAARDTQSATRDSLRDDLGVQRFTGAELSLELRSQLCLRPLSPVAHLRELARTQPAVREPSLLGVRNFRNALLSVVSRHLRAYFRRAGARRPRRTLTDLGRSLVDALLAQPVERLERIAVSHPRSVAKPRAAQFRSTNHRQY
jgi:hypothetical protein